MANGQALRFLAGAESQQPHHRQQGHQLPDQGHANRAAAALRLAAMPCIAPTARWAPSCAARRPSWERPRPSRRRRTSWPGSSTPCCATARDTWMPEPSTTSVPRKGVAGREAESGATGLPAGADGRCSRPRPWMPTATAATGLCLLVIATEAVSIDFCVIVCHSTLAMGSECSDICLIFVALSQFPACIYEYLYYCVHPALAAWPGLRSCRRGPHPACIYGKAMQPELERGKCHKRRRTCLRRTALRQAQGEREQRQQGRTERPDPESRPKRDAHYRRRSRSLDNMTFRAYYSVLVYRNLLIITTTKESCGADQGGNQNQHECGRPQVGRSRDCRWRGGTQGIQYHVSPRLVAHAPRNPATTTRRRSGLVSRYIRRRSASSSLRGPSSPADTSSSVSHPARQNASSGETPAALARSTSTSAVAWPLPSIVATAF